MKSENTNGIRRRTPANTSTAIDEVNFEEYWDDENVIQQSWEVWERNRYIKILFEKGEDDIHLPNSLNVTPSFDDYRDYRCFEGCGCDQIPIEDKYIISRNHFHYYHEEKLYWSNLTNDRLDAFDLQNGRGSYAALIEEVNVDLKKTYEIPSRHDYEVVGKKVNGIQFSLKFLSLIKARDHFRQVLSVSDTNNYPPLL